MMEVEAGIEREDLVECLIYNSFIARIKMQDFESVNALLFFYFAAAARIVATDVSVVAL